MNLVRCEMEKLDLKSAYSLLWNKAFEKVWPEFPRNEIPDIDDKADGSNNNSDLKARSFAHQMMIHAVFTFITDQLECHENKHARTDEKVKHLEEEFANFRSNFQQNECSPDVESSTVKDAALARNVTPSPGKSSQESEASPSLLRQKYVRRRLVRSPKSKENKPVCMDPPNGIKEEIVATTGSFHDSQHVFKRNTTRATLTSSKNDAMANGSKVPLTFKGGFTPTKSPSQPNKKMIQTRLDLNRVVPKVERVDLSSQEEYLGGARVLKRKGDSNESEKYHDSEIFLQPMPGGVHSNRRKSHAVDIGDKNVDLDETCFVQSSQLQESHPAGPQDVSNISESPSLFPDEIVEHNNVCTEQPLKGLSRRKAGRPGNDPVVLGENIKPSTSNASISDRGFGNDTMEAISDFNKRPRQEQHSPKFKYKPEAVRKKADREKLNAIPCDLCKEYYEALASQLDDRAIESIVNKCSKHRQQFKPREYDTPPDYWRTDIPSTEDCLRDGLIRIEHESNPANRYKI